MKLYDFISLEAMEFFFSDEHEVFEKDVSEVHVICILYRQDRLLDISVDVFGRKGTDALPLYSEIAPLEAEEVRYVPVISPSFVLRIFDDRILRIFSDKGLKVFWNPGWPVSAVINPLHPDLSMKLLPKVVT